MQPDEISSGRNAESIWALPDERFFGEGGCHALALEIAGELSERGRKTEFWFLSSKQHHALAEHVVVKCDNQFFDINGPQTEEELIARWSAKTADAVTPVEHPGWISKPTRGTTERSHLGLWIEPTWLEKARARARNFIEANRAKLGLD
jgi:hypothetical protein